MFYVSARNNAKAADFDAANSLAITAAELFKTDPKLEGEGMFSSEPGALLGKTWRSPDGARLVKYYDAGWRELDFLLPAPGFDPEAPTDAQYILDAAFGDRVDGESDPNYVHSSLTLKLDSTQEYRLVINDNSSEMVAVFNGMNYSLDKSVVGSVISLNVEYSPEGVLPKHITVYNRTSMTVNLNVFGAPDAGDENRNGYIDISPVTGAVSVMYLDEQVKTALSETRVFTVCVRGLSDGGAELTRIEASKYIPE